MLRVDYLAVGVGGTSGESFGLGAPPGVPRHGQRTESIAESITAVARNLLADRVGIEWVAAVDDQRIGLGEREVRQVVDVRVEVGGEHLARIGADRRPVTDVPGVGWSKKIAKWRSGASTTSMWCG